MKILLVDDHSTVRLGIRLVLQAAEDLEVVGEAADGAAAVSMVLALSPDVVLMDLRMPVMDGIAATAQISGQTRVIVLTTFDDDDYLFGALQAGAHGFLLKTAEPQAIIDAVRAAGRGQSVLDPQVTARVMERALAAAPPAVLPEGLTAREREVLQGIGEGLSNPQLAQRLGIGESTVKTHVSAVLAKLGVSTRLQAAKIAYGAGG
ncbi:response regulator [Glutamicibacter soli]|uniref:Response regulator n=1 Tax=Glutamicibacter soli TaxID=453836 RepID=A0A6L9G8F7_9MICC|nr:MULTISPECIES: response regulator transcription factor [Micrococcaceae]NAZ15506.1 response regulator [Glutamicibacter soli]RKS21021.1 LuxR family two component transcriptional regulator [Arthrobacter sp. AG1021]